MARLGPDATLEALELDGARVHLVDSAPPDRPPREPPRDARDVPDPDRGLVAGLPGLRLERMRGTLEMTAPALRAEVSFEPAEAASVDAWVDGTLSLGGLSLGAGRYAGAARVRLTSTRFSVSSLRLAREGCDAALEGEASGGLASGAFRPEQARLVLADLPLADLAAAFGVNRLADSDERVRGRLEIERGQLRASVSVGDAPEDVAGLGSTPPIEAPAESGEDASTALSVEGAFGDGAVDLRVEGFVDPALLRVAGLPIEGAVIPVAGTLRGELRALRLALSAHAPLLCVAGVETTRARLRLIRDASGLSVEGSARSGSGRIMVTRQADGAIRAKVERLAVAALGERAAMLTRIGVRDGELWADVRYAGGFVEGAAHLESSAVAITLQPLRFAAAERVLVDTRARVVLSAGVLARQVSGAELPIEGLAELVLRIEKASLGASPAVHGRGSVCAERLVFVRGGKEIALSETTAELVIDGDRCRVERARASLLGGTVSGTATLSWRERKLQAWVDELAIESIRLPFGRQPVLNGALARHEGALRGRLDARTDRSRLTLRPVVHDSGALHGTELEGMLAVEDVPPIERALVGPARAPLPVFVQAARTWTSFGPRAVPSSRSSPRLVQRPGSNLGSPVPGSRGGRWRIAGRVEGSLASPRLELGLTTEHQSVRLGPVKLDLRDIRAEVRLSRQRVRWTVVEARGYGGVLRAKGSFSSSSRTTSAHFAVEGVDAGSLPLPQGTLAQHLEGRLSGTLNLWRSPAVRAGRARLSVDAPVCHFVERAAPVLGRNLASGSGASRDRLADRGAALRVRALAGDEAPRGVGRGRARRTRHGPSPWSAGRPVGVAPVGRVAPKEPIDVSAGRALAGGAGLRRRHARLAALPRRPARGG